MSSYYMEFGPFGDNDERVIFISDIDGYDAEELEARMADYLDCEVFLCVTNGEQDGTESLLEADGWKEVYTASKDVHVRQRELGSSYIKLWALDNKNYQGNQDELLYIRAQENMKQPQFHFLKNGSEFFKNIPDLTPERVRDVVDRLKVSGTVDYHTSFTDDWPFIHNWNIYLTKKALDDIRTIHKELFGFVLPETDPFTGRAIGSIKVVNRMLDRLRDGLHEKEV